MIKIQDHRINSDIVLRDLNINQAFYTANCTTRLYVVSDKTRLSYDLKIQCHCLSEPVGAKGEASLMLRSDLRVIPVNLLIAVQDYKNAD